MRSPRAVLLGLASLLLLGSACVSGLTQDIQSSVPTIVGEGTPTPAPTVTQAAATAPVATVAPTSPTGSTTTGNTTLSVQGLPPIAEVADKVLPAVVTISTESVTVDRFFGQGIQRGAGSGMIFDAKNGYILTNAHVVEGAQQVKVGLLDQRTFDAKVVGSDPARDLAVLKIDPKGEALPTVKLGSSGALRIGEWVIAVGNALGEGISVTQGIISAKGRTIGTEGECQLEGVLQTDAAINPGNSGGPLINLNGEVVGVNTAIARGAEGIGFAIAMDKAKPIIQQLIEHGSAAGDPFVGITYTVVDSAIQQQFRLAVSQGILVTGVVSGGPAQRAGLRPGDVITSFGGKAVTTTNDFSTALDAQKVNDVVTVEINRYGQNRSLKLTLGETPRTCG